jgi:branched-subunit amino acid ABC-type transport system permease component
MLDFSGAAARVALLVDHPAIAFIQFMNGLSQGMVLFVIAAGLTLIFGVLRVLNFAHGAFYMVGGYAMYTGTQHLAFPGGFWVAVLAAASFMAAIAWLVETLLLRRLYRREQLDQLVFTFALVLLLTDFVRAGWGAQIYRVPYPPLLAGATDLGITFYPSYLLFLAVFGAAVAILLAVTVDRTRAGRLMRAATQDAEMLSALGVNVRRLYTSVFVIGSFLAGLAGALAAPRSGLDLSIHAAVIVDCFIVVVIGGLGSLWGALIAALLIGQVRVFGALILPAWEIALVYLLMVLVLMTRPWGLLGTPPARRG